MTIVAGLKIGDVIAGKYRVETILGAGGMGVVAAARHLSLDDVVAIKFLSAELAGDPTAVSRFDREARAAAKIKSEHVVRVFDVDRLPSGAPYMVMEYLEGSDLAALIRDGRALSDEQAAEFVLQACAALAEAHRLGIVHRDIKPSNLFCVRRSERGATLKLLDFGISKLVLTSDSINGVITGTAAAIGSPSYMSPEQMRSAARVDARTDIWSLGVVLYELVTGKLPFRAATYPELCLKVAGDAPDSPRLYRPDISAELEAIILRCLEKECDRRYATVVALAEALSPLAPNARHMVERVRDAAVGPDGIAPDREAAATFATAKPLITAEAPAAKGRNLVTNATWTSTALPQTTQVRRRLLRLGAALALGLPLALAAALWAGKRDEPALTAQSAAAPALSSSPDIAAARTPAPTPTPERPPTAAASAPPQGAIEVAPVTSSASAVGGSAKATPRDKSTPNTNERAPLAAPKAVTTTSTGSAPSQRSRSAVWNQRD